MLAARAAETIQHIFGDVIAARNRDRLDRLGHMRDCDEMNPSATSSGRAQQLAVFCASAVNFSRTSAASSGSFCSGPKIAGKNSGSSFPAITLASVTASGPPRR